MLIDAGDYYWIHAGQYLFLVVAGPLEYYEVIPWYQYPSIQFINYQMWFQRDRRDQDNFQRYLPDPPTVPTWTDLAQQVAGAGAGAAIGV